MKADIIIYKASGIIGNLISFISKAKYTHVAIYLSENKIIESTWRGVKINQFKDEKGIEIYSFTNLSEENREKIIQFIMSKINSKYDYSLLLTIIFERWFGVKPLDKQDAYICSELIDMAYNSIGIDIFKGRYLNPTPEELRNALRNLDDVQKYEWKY
jgi:uncharacterized protein YycO